MSENPYHCWIHCWKRNVMISWFYKTNYFFKRLFLPLPNPNANVEKLSKNIARRNMTSVVAENQVGWGKEIAYIYIIFHLRHKLIAFLSIMYYSIFWNMLPFVKHFQKNNYNNLELPSYNTLSHLFVGSYMLSLCAILK